MYGQSLYEVYDLLNVFQCLFMSFTYCFLLIVNLLFRVLFFPSGKLINRWFSRKHVTAPRNHCLLLIKLITAYNMEFI